MSAEITTPNAQEAPWAAAQAQAGVAVCRSAAATRRAGYEAMMAFLAMERTQEVILAADPTSALPGTKAFVALTAKLKNYVLELLLEQARRNDLGLSIACNLHEMEKGDAEYLSDALQASPDTVLARHEAEFALDAPSPGTTKARADWFDADGAVRRIHARLPVHLDQWMNPTPPRTTSL